MFCFTDFPALIHTKSPYVTIFFLARGILLGGVRAEMFLQEDRSRVGHCHARRAAKRREYY